MHKRVKALFSGDGLRALALRGTLSSAGLAIGSQILRFVSNMILTRLLFPEAFGLMALVHIVLIGLQMISQFGLRAAIMQSPRGDEEIFLHTAWGMQIIRNILLWVVVCVTAPFFAYLYDQPTLTYILPAAGLSLIVTGFHTINVLRVQRHMQLGLHSILSLVASLIGLIVMVVMAWVLGTVWALVWGMVVQSVISLIIFKLFLPGIKDRFRMERAAAFEILNFGKFLFVSSTASYIMKQSDRAVLGLFIPIDLLGIYGLALALGTLPGLLATAIAQSVVFPLYRMCHPMDSPENQINIFRTRRLVAAGTVALTVVLAFLGPWLILLLYDARYAAAGPITTLLCTAAVPQVVLNGAMNAALIKGDSFRFMMSNVVTAICQGVLMYLGVSAFGIPGAAFAIAAGPLLTYPLLAFYLHPYRNWDPKGEIGLMLLGFALTGAACWLYWDQIVTLLP